MALQVRWLKYREGIGSPISNIAEIINLQIDKSLNFDSEDRLTQLRPFDIIYIMTIGHTLFNKRFLLKVKLVFQVLIP